MKKELSDFISKYEKNVIDLSEKAGQVYFKATISGNQEDYSEAAKYELELNKIFTDKKDFEKVKYFKQNLDKIDNKFLKREIEIIYNEYAGNQFDPNLLEEIIKLSNKVEERFSTYRAEIDGKEYTDNEIDDVLEKSTDSEKLKKFWESSKHIGEEVVGDVVKLVKMRNAAAQELGYNNYHQMSLSLSEQNPDEIEKLFDELDSLTRESFIKLKDEIDEHLSKLYKINKSELMPWHYQDKFFQQGPKIYDIDLDKFFENQDTVEITRKYFNGIGLEIDDILENSDLFEKPGKYQHAYCTNINRSGDVRVLCNVKHNHKWMGTLLHEFGHAVYDKYVSDKLPWTLRSHAHIFTTEAIAMMFGRFASNPTWLQDVLGISEDEKNEISGNCFNNLRLEQLVFSRWVQVMYRFEKRMYENPNQDLNSLWWELVEKYQLIKKPEGRDSADFAAKIHVALYPAYYHNYMLGELLASQLYHYITEKVIDKSEASRLSFNKVEAVGKYLVELFFSPGAFYHWSELIKKSTGEELTAKYYADQFVSVK